MSSEQQFSKKTLNVLGTPLQLCSCEPMTGWYRDGFCHSDDSDLGEHIVCCVMTKSFLTYSKAQGNDLSTAMPQYGFPGLNQGDHWCLCASRWLQAYEDGMAPMVDLKATSIGALKIINIELLKQYSFSENNND